MTKIQDLTNVLREVRQEFQDGFKNAESTRKAATATLNTDYVRGSDSFKQKQKEIEVEYTASIIAAQRSAAERANVEIESLRDFEISRVSRVDSDTLQKINSISELPLSYAELKALTDRFGTNYWNQRALANIAEKNGINPQNLGIETNLNIKLSVLQQMQDQLDSLLSEYNTNINDHSSRNARLLYLSDPVLQNAENLYTYGSTELVANDTVGKAYATIAAMPSQMQKALMISNSLSNLRGNERNMLLYQLATDNSISDQIYQVAGCSNEIRQWKSGLAMRFAETAKMSDNLRAAVDVNGIRTTVSSYRDKLRESGAENPFLDDALATLAKSNSAVAEAIGVANTTMDTTDAEEAESAE